MERKIEKKIFISGKIEVLTGLHIGGTETGINIGGLDKGAVIRDAISNEPYIPGSSLKGKMRSLLEKLRGEYEIDKDGKAGPSKNSADLSAKIFGISAEDDEKAGETTDFKSSRVVVRDAFLTGESRDKLIEANLELPFTETKTETVIDRVTSKANPRTIERVPKNSEFDFDMILTIYEGDIEAELIDGVFTTMTLLQEDYLGGHGSRGSGKIKFHLSELSEKSNESYKNGQDKTQSAVEIPAELK